MFICFPYYQEQQSQEKCSARTWNSPRGTPQLLLPVTDAQDQILKFALHIPKILIISTTMVIRRHNVFLKLYTAHIYLPSFLQDAYLAEPGQM